MKVEKTELPEVLVVVSPVHRDERGFFTEVHHAEKFATLGLPTSFAQDNHSRSSRGTIRGLHFQLENPQGKLVRPVTGRLFDVAVDVRRSSPRFGAWTAVELEAGDGRQLWIPPGFAHGFLVLSEYADVCYKCTTVYDPKSDRGVRWDDPTIGILWPSMEDVPRLSAKDAIAPLLADATVYD